MALNFEKNMGGRAENPVLTCKAVKVSDFGGGMLHAI